ncbi:alpha-E domain-containing protein [Nonomuraea basaltis]|uniref:alpha-E domain-containing protein n=1 Tax=Nonomuraea basaltis TaxID=2495887 RepID=UPI00110C6CC2|nr:alpha-E domain-containing protein [Nonomuraea basaltis]TMR91636.1 alpha-E domain-containing protein [Nonomuraea basaltis]
MTRPLLSRIAETLYWIGRYVERADDTARLLDVSVHRMLDEPDTCSSLHAVLGLSSAATVSAPAVIRRVAYDLNEPASIASSVRLARDSARGVREVLSSEVWECLNVTWHHLSGLESLTPHGYLAFVRERAALFFGLVDATMSRDDCWRFIVLGRSLERVDMTTRLMAVHLAGDRRLLLQASGADESFTRTHGARDGEVLEFLLLDRLFPRSIVYSLLTAEKCLRALAPDTARVGVADSAQAAIGRVRTGLEYTDLNELNDRLPELLGTLQEACAAAGEAIAQRFFQRREAMAWVGA